MSNNTSSINKSVESSMDQSINLNLTPSTLNAPVDFSLMSDILNLSEIQKITNIVDSTDNSEKSHNNVISLISTPIRTLKKKDCIPNQTEDNHNHENYKAALCTSSTPRQSKLSLVSKEDIIMCLKPKSVENNETNSTMLSKSSNILIKILGTEKIVFEFDKARKNLKKIVSNDTKEIYREIIAKLEVKLTMKNDDLREQLKKIELENLKKSSHLNTLPINKGDQDSYDNLLKQLQYLKIIRKQLFDEH